MTYFFRIFLISFFYDNFQESVLQEKRCGCYFTYLADYNPVRIYLFFQLEHNNIDALGLIGDIDGYAG